MNTCLKCHKQRESSQAYCNTCIRKIQGYTKTFETTTFQKSGNNQVVYARGFCREYDTTHKKYVRHNVWSVH